MRKLLLAVAILAGIIIGQQLHVVKAQSGNPLQMQVSGVHTACTVTAATTSFCFATDGLWQSLNGAAYTQLGGTASASLTVNGVTKTLPATFNITAATAQPLSTAVVTTTAPATSVTVQ